MVGSVLKIKQFYKENGNEERLNVKALQLHSSAYILYELGVVMYVVAWDLTICFPDSDALADAYMYVYTLEILISTVAQALLCLIFWKLAKKL